MKKIGTLLAASALVGASLATIPQAEARPGVKESYAGYYGGRRHNRSRGGNAAAAAAIVGVTGALIGAGIAASQRDRYYEPRGYYGPAPAYGYGYRPYYDD